MKQILKIAVLVLFAGALWGAPARFSFSSTKASASSYAVSISQPATGAKQVNVEGFWLYCLADGTATVAVNGSAPTATAATPRGFNPDLGAAKMNAWTDSDSTGGTTVLVVDCLAKETHFIPLGVKLAKAGAAQNLRVTAAPNTSTTTLRVSLIWSEE